jgi:hypothetical protein
MSKSFPLLAPNVAYFFPPPGLFGDSDYGGEGLAKRAVQPVQNRASERKSLTTLILVESADQPKEKQRGIDVQKYASGLRQVYLKKSKTDSAIHWI